MTRNLLLLAIAIALGWAGLQFVHGDPPQQPRAEAALPVGVTVAEVQRRDLPLTISAAGRTEARNSVAVKSRLDGQVAAVAFTPGQPVHKGQLLVRIDPALLETQLRQAEGVLARDEAQVVRLNEDYRRNLALVGQGAVSKSSLGQAEADLRSAQAGLKADRANLDNARLQLGFTRITAPMDGVAGALLLSVGGAARANDTTLLVINQIKPIYVSFSLSESQLAPLKRVMNKGEVPVRASVAGIDQPITGKLAFIDNAVDATNGAITVKAIFANADGMLTPGQFARVAVQLDQLRNVLVVPSQAVEGGVDGPYAFVIDSHSTALIRPLQVGAETDGYRVVTAGLAAGERVVMTGQARLRDKSKVRISPAPAPSAQPP